MTAGHANHPTGLVCPLPSSALLCPPLPSFALLYRLENLPAIAMHQAHDQREERRPDDSPDEWEGLPFNVEGQQEGQPQRSCQPVAYQRPDKPHPRRDQPSPKRILDNGLTQCTADSGNHNHKDDTENGHTKTPPEYIPPIFPTTLHDT